MKIGDRVKTIDGMFEGVITKKLKSGLMIFIEDNGYHHHYHRPENLILIKEDKPCK